MTKDTEKNFYANDHWTLNDELGIAGTGDTLAKMALDVSPPFAIRLTGKWGAGKTSILRRAYATLAGEAMKQAVPLAEDNFELNEEEWSQWAYNYMLRKPKLSWRDEEEFKEIINKSLCVWFSPWQHQNAENPMLPLLLEINAQYQARLEGFDYLKSEFKNVARNAGLAAMTLLEKAIDAAFSLGTGKVVKFAQGTTAQVQKAWKEKGNNSLQLNDGQRFHLIYEDAVEKLLSSLPDHPKFDENGKKSREKDLVFDPEAKAGRLIIFIDDLDRCEESTIVNLLESIKLYLSTKHCVFLFGIDDSAVLGALKRVWSSRGEDSNREYLEKLFQATVPIPVPLPQNIQKRIILQLKAHDFPDDKKNAEHIKQLAEHIERLLEPNPRKIKNFVNTLCASWTLFGKERKESLTENWGLQLILFTYLRIFQSSVWRLLERQPQALPVLYQTLTGEEGNFLPPLPPEKEHLKLDSEAQTMLKQMFSKAFNHVLKKKEEEKEDKHQKLSLEEAVLLFEERQDRKCSDEYFIDLFFKVLKPESIVDQSFLSLS